MKTSAIYFIVLMLLCFSCSPMNHTIGMRQLYVYPDSKTFAKQSSPDLKKILSVPLQTFIISSSSDTILYGTEGTIIFIHPMCLHTNDSVYKGKITFELKELFTKEALLRERAYTVSDNSMLESDGSVYIQAFSENGAPLFIGCEDAVQIRLPREIKSDMIFLREKEIKRGI